VTTKHTAIVATQKYRQKTPILGPKPFFIYFVALSSEMFVYVKKVSGVG
jgi:hypothetical protein